MSAHSLLQEASAGRNLITLFSTVNNRMLFFFARARRCTAKRAQWCNANIHQRLHRTITPLHAVASNASTGAACSAASTSISNIASNIRRTTMHGKHACIACFELVMLVSQQRCICASHKSVCAKTARTFSDARRTSHTISHACITTKKKTRNVAVAGR